LTSLDGKTGNNNIAAGVNCVNNGLIQLFFGILGAGVLPVAVG